MALSSCMLSRSSAAAAAPTVTAMAKITVDDRDDHDESRYGRLPPRIAPVSPSQG
jgi:hypothetical protein